MVWFCDTETVQLSVKNIDKIKPNRHSNHIKKRLEASEEYVKRMYKEHEQAKKYNEKLSKVANAKNRKGLRKRRLVCGGEVFHCTRPSPLQYVEEDRPLITVNVLNTAISESGEELMTYHPDIILQRIAKKVLQRGEKRCTVYYHNLKFDMTNVLDFLMFTQPNKLTVKGSLIVGNKWYAYDLMYKGVYFHFIDSYNLTMMGLAEFGEAFNLPKELWKKEYDFDFENVDNINLMLKGDKNLESYAMDDVRCQRAGVQAFKKFAGADKMTIASTAFANWQDMENFQLAKLTIREQVEADYTYTGAICYFNPIHQNKIYEKDFVYLDVNGLYSAASYTESNGFRHPFPVGMGVRKEGTPDFNNIDKYFTIRCTITATVKPTTTIPFFRLGKQSNKGLPMNRTDEKGNKKPYKQNEYLRQFSETCFINSIDLRLLHKYYHVKKIVFHHYWEYETETGIFDKYIDYWAEQKRIGSETGNKPLKTVAKFMLNALTGKFGQFIESVDTSVDFDEVTKILSQERHATGKDPQMLYMPIVSAILAYAREIFLDMSDKIPRDDFYYGDTDSNIIPLETFEKYVDKSKIHKTKLGFWDIEYHIKKLKIIRQKTYMFTTDKGKVECKCAGASPTIKALLNYENFEINARIKGATQLKPKLIVGGTALVKQPFVLRAAFRG